MNKYGYGFTKLLLSQSSCNLHLHKFTKTTRAVFQKCCHLGVPNLEITDESVRTEVYVQDGNQLFNRKALFQL